MIFGAKEEIIPKYYDDDKPKSVQKTSFGLVRIILLWLAKVFARLMYKRGMKWQKSTYKTIFRRIEKNERTKRKRKEKGDE